MVAQKTVRLVGFLKVDNGYEPNLYDGPAAVASFVVNPSYAGKGSGWIATHALS